MKKKNAIMLADTRIGLVGTVLIQIKNTNPNLFEEAIIYYLEDISESDKKLMQSIMPCRFVKYAPALPNDIFEKPRFKLFSKLMFARFEMYDYLEEFETITWIDTDVCIQGDLTAMVDAGRKSGMALIQESPINKTAENPDTMRTCFVNEQPGYDNSVYSYCSGTIVLTDLIKNGSQIKEWSYKKVVEWADNLSLPDQGVINASIQEFNIKVTPLNGKKYCCYPYMGRDCSGATIIHSWGLNKFWNDWYVYLHYTGWGEAYSNWVGIGGTSLNYEIVPRISVVIPTYKPNLEYFSECMDSLIKQKRDNWERFSDFEIIIVSEPIFQDELSEFVEKYHDKRIRLIFNEERLGIAASINRGIDAAKGRYIARIDDDDIAAVERLFLQAEYLDKNPDISLCTTNFAYFGDMNEVRLSFDGEMAKAWGIFTCPFDHPTIMFRKDFFENNGLRYDEERGYVEDWELWQRAFEKGLKVGAIPNTLFYHRWINNSSAGQSNKTVIMMREMIQNNFQKLDVQIPDEDLGLIGPWNGRIVNEQDIEKVEGYFSLALENNITKNLYDQKSLERAFLLRLEEARNGVLPGLVLEKKDTSELSIEAHSNVSVKKNRRMLKILIKKMLYKFYRPFAYRVTIPLAQINETVNNIYQIVKRNEADICALKNDLECVRANSDKHFSVIYDDFYNVFRNHKYYSRIIQDEIASKKKAFLIGTSEHSNIGDAAISYGEWLYLRKEYPEYRIVELSTYDFEDYYDLICNTIMEDDLIFLQGGGNVGSKYLNEENLRQRVITDFPNNKIIILPQTVFFDEGDTESIEKVAKVYSGHKKLTFYTRGEQSLNFVKENLGVKDAHMAPDMAMNISYSSNSCRSGILVCLRSKSEGSILSCEDVEQIFDIVGDFDACETSNNHYSNNSECNIYKEERRKVVFSELGKFASKRVVITDRLHGVIFSIITNTPCVALAADNYKLEEYCEMVNSENVRYIGHDIVKIKETVSELIK